MKTTFSIFISALLSAVLSCSTAARADTARTDIREIIGSPEVMMVDVRVPEQYAEATADHAVNIPLAEIPARAASLKGKKVVVFCNKGIQADQAAEILRKNGVETYNGTTWQNVKALQEEQRTVQKKEISLPE